MSPLIWFVLGVAVLASLAFLNHKRTQQSLTQLEQSGFVVSHDFGGRPQLLLDKAAAELAWAEGAKLERASLNTLEKSELGWDAKPSQDTNYRIELTFTGRKAPVRIHYPNEVAARQALQRLQGELP